jgi:hypothetical protein
VLAQQKQFRVIERHLPAHRDAADNRAHSNRENLAWHPRVSAAKTSYACPRPTHAHRGCAAAKNGAV